MSLSNYEKLENGIIRQINIKKIDYNFEYSNKYNAYGEKSNLSYLRMGVLLGLLLKPPESLLDVGYGNGDFLKVASTAIENCYGSDISDYPIPMNCKKVDLFEKRHYDVICFFDSLEHFDDIYFIEKLDCDYIYISVPWCHNFTSEWFLQWYHRRENEHLWHFNKSSLIQFFGSNNYECVYSSNVEDVVRKNPNSLYYPNILTCLFKKQKMVHDDVLNYYNNKKILITGGTGFIGRNIVNELLKYDVEKIYIFDRTIKYKWEHTSKIVYIEGNLLYDMDKISEIDFDIVFHKASKVDTTCRNVKNMMELIFNVFVELVNICNAKNAKLVYASIDSIYRNLNCPNMVGLNETQLNAYDESKLLIDNYVKEQSENLKINVIGIRYFDVYGNGENHKGEMMSMVSQIFNRIKENKDVQLFDFGEQKRDFVYVKDVANFNILAGLSDNTDIYNCGYGKTVEFNEIFNIIQSYFKGNSKFQNITPPHVEISPNNLNIQTGLNESNADLQRNYDLLKFRPQYNIIDGIRDYMTEHL
jgi:ADP-L-glycero-D-manno-heptose 6-epimerase